MNGFLIVDKPSGMTSQTVCNKIKRKFNLNKIGHNGTLDPETTGVMVIAINRATRLIQYLENEDKTYQTTIVFGYDSNTLDIFGNITKDIPMNLDDKAITQALEKLKASKTQLPPMVSAIKVNGKKLMSYERNNQEVEVKERAIKIFSIKRLSNLRLVAGHYEIDLELHVSKGFYVRSFARDLGILCGGCAIMKKLRRTKAGNFTEQMAIGLEEILNKDLELIKIDEIFNYPKIEANERILTYIKNGVTIYPYNLTKDCHYKDYTKLTRFYFTYQGKNVSIYQKENDIFRPIFIF